MKLSSIIFILSQSVVFSQVITVNLNGTADFTAIQSAINAAVTGDTVLVADGVYTGTGNRDISFAGKAITVRSQNGPANCIIDGLSLQGINRGFFFNSAETRASILEGFTVRNFYYLTCADGGAGIYIANGSPTIRDCTITNCRIQLNSYCPAAQVYGAGISVMGGSPLFERCIISHNSGAFRGGGIACASWTNPGGVWVFLTNCYITKNAVNASYYAGGGGISLYYGPNATVTNCTIADNTRYGLYCADPAGPGQQSSQFNENILWGNTSGQTFGYSLVYSRVYVQGLNPDPRFVDPANGDYHLQWDSPCINYCQYAVYNPGDLDFDGEPRRMGTYVDAGADEVGPKQADFSRNGRIGLDDLVIFSAAWQTSPVNANWYLLCDLQKDSVININDLAILAADWLWQADWFEN